MTVSTDAAIPAEADIISVAADIQTGARNPGLFYPWLVVAFLMLVYTSSFIDRTILSLLVQPIRADLHLSDSEYSYLGGLAFVVLYSLSSVPLGSLVDRSSRRAIIAVGIAAWSIMTAGCGIATSFWRLFAFRVGVGIGEATLSSATCSRVRSSDVRCRCSAWAARSAPDWRCSWADRSLPRWLPWARSICPWSA